MNLDVLQLIRDAGPVVKFVMFLLIGMSVFSWGIIFLKWRLLRMSRKNSEAFLEFFWSQKNMEGAFKRADDTAVCPVASVFKAGFLELQRSRESAGKKVGEIDSDEIRGILANVERSLRRSATSQLTMLERRIPFLATTGSSAPFIGLFGTVWGIMNAFLNIGASGASNLAVVAPGISEALIATAMGLVAAIPAVIGYNYSVSQIRVLQRDMENFSNDFLNVIKRQLGAQ